MPYSLLFFFFFENFVYGHCIYIISSPYSALSNSQILPITSQLHDFFNYYCDPPPSHMWSPISAAYTLCVFKVDHLGLDNISGSLSLEKTDSSSLSGCHCL